MLATNLKILGVVLGTILLYTLLAGSIPQVESEVPEELVLGADFSVEEIVAAGEELYFGAGGCTTCHGLGTRAPHLLEGEPGQGAIGARCGSRVPGLSCKEYLHQSMTQPNAVVVEGFEPIMPDMSRTLSPAQVWAIIAFLQSQEGEVTVLPEDVQQASQATGAEPGQPLTGTGGPAGAAPSATMEPVALLRENQCLVCHQLGTEGGPIGPPLTGMGARLDRERIRRAILLPNADTADGYAAVAGTMPATFGQQLTAAQMEALVDFLASQR
jgi:mono/diheme cytochrome c family protein